MTAAFVTNPLMLEATHAAVAEPKTDTAGDSGLPEEVRTFLARARLLEGVPFQHLVPDSALLPPESMRFFFLDREWTDALTQGALSVGTVTTVDHRQLETRYKEIRDEVDMYERRVRMVGGEDAGFHAAGTVTGFLLRSRVVSGWPALHVRGFAKDMASDTTEIDINDPSRVRLLRLERLAPAVLLCLFDGLPRLVHIEEPRQGVQYGIELQSNGTATLQLRNVFDAQLLKDHKNAPQPFTVQVPFRNVFTGTAVPAGPGGVVAVRTLADRISGVKLTGTGHISTRGFTSAEMAMELVQFPFRQVFGPVGTAVDTGAAFAPSIAAAEAGEEPG